MLVYNMYKCISWNLNSFPKREEHLKLLLQQHNPDMVFLQEVRTDKMPEMLNSYYVYTCSNSGSAGVSILSKKPLTLVETYIEPGRLLIMTDGKYHYASVYMYSGFSVSSGVDKKLKFFQHIINLPYANLILGGDWNVVYKSNECNIVNPFSAPEIKMLQLLETKFKNTTPNKQFLTWFDYRTFRYNAYTSHYGLGLDKFFISHNMDDCESEVLFDYRILAQPSDHAPVLLKNIRLYHI